jgi:class 3 adenylate cyclase
VTDITELEKRLLTPPEGVLDPEDSPGGSEALHAIQLLLVAATDTRRFGGAMTELVASLEPRLDELSIYDQARFHHLVGVKAWRLDGSVDRATRAFNTSARLLAEAGGDRAARYLGRVRDSSGQHLHQQGLLGEARNDFERALRIREQTGDVPGEAITLGNLGRLCLEYGEFAEAKAYFERDVEIVRLRTPERTRTIAQLLSHIANCQLQLEEAEAARATLNESRRIAIEAEDVVSELYALIGLGRVDLLAKGDSKAAGALAKEKAVAVEARLDELAWNPALRSDMATVAGHLHADACRALGRLDEALSHCDRAIAARVSPIELAELLSAKAEILVERGKSGEAADTLRRALHHLDGTAAVMLRGKVEARLKSLSTDAWLLHAAGRFVGQHHIESLLTKAGEAGFRGSRQHQTILFSDIRGFTSLSEKLNPEELIVLLNDFLGLMTGCIERHGGTVDKFIGDAVMARFEGGTAAAAASAIEAALAMRDELERFNGRLPAGVSALAIGIGLHRGDLVAGLIGSPQKREFTVIGDVVNTASRLEGMTKQLGATILISEAVLEGVDRSRFLLRPLGGYSPKGRKEPLRVFDVMNERDRSPSSARMLAEIERVTAALAQFEARHFAEAAAEFEALGPRYAFLSGIAREYSTSAPSPNWNGAVELTSK